MGATGKRVKRFLKCLWAEAWVRTGLIRLYLYLGDRVFRKGAVCILLYHRVVPENDMRRVYAVPEIVVSEETFEIQMQCLSAFRVASMEQAVSELHGEGPPRPLSVVITFDDGWEDNHRHAFPVLKRFRLPATIFVSTDFIGRDRLFWQDRVVRLVRSLRDTPDVLRELFRRNGLGDLLSLLEEVAADKGGGGVSPARLTSAMKKLEEGKIARLLKDGEALLRDRHPSRHENAFLDWDQVREMSEGGIDFGSHGTSHRLLDGLEDREVAKELAESKRIIETQVGRPVSLFAYPNGNYNAGTIASLEASGFKAAATVVPGHNGRKTDPFRLRRINVCEGRFLGPDGRFSKALFTASLAGLL